MKRAKTKVIRTEIFHNFAEVCRVLSNSIISDADMVYEFNKLTENKKSQIAKEISCIDTNSKADDLREDVAAPSFPTEKILANALSSENSFVVPKVVE